MPCPMFIVGLRTIPMFCRFILFDEYCEKRHTHAKVLLHVPVIKYKHNNNKITCIDFTSKFSDSLVWFLLLSRVRSSFLLQHVQGRGTDSFPEQRLVIEPTWQGPYIPWLFINTVGVQFAIFWLCGSRKYPYPPQGRSLQIAWWSNLFYNMRHVSEEPCQQCSVTSRQFSEKKSGFFQLVFPVLDTYIAYNVKHNIQITTTSRSFQTNVMTFKSY